jgi:hypothetical protein
MCSKTKLWHEAHLGRGRKFGTCLIMHSNSIMGGRDGDGVGPGPSHQRDYQTKCGYDSTTNHSPAHDI